tara:strand:+ start:3663 stop:3779 length:117 start_codon:yes stop_codon:yes gene_type:complete
MLNEINELLDPVVEMVEKHANTIAAFGIGSYFVFLLMV